MNEHKKCKCKWCQRKEVARGAFVYMAIISIFANAILGIGGMDVVSVFAIILAMPGIFLLLYALGRRSQIQETIQRKSDTEER